MALFALFVDNAAKATTVAFTPSSLEVITTGAATRTFYDLDDVFVRYKTGVVVVYSTERSTILFQGDTSEVSVTGATHWGAKAAKLGAWYQKATNTDGYTYYFPRRDVNFVYKGGNGQVKVVSDDSKNLLFETSIDSIYISGVSGASAKLTYFRGQYFLDALRSQLGVGSTPTIAAGSAAGTSPTISIAGTATGFKVTLTTGTSASNSGVLWTATLPFTFPNGVIPYPTNGNANAAAHAIRVYTTGTTSTIVMNATGTALSDATQYVWNVGYTGY